MELSGKQVLIVGLARSGMAAARLCAQEGARVTATDLRSAEQLGADAQLLADLGVTLELGEHRDEIFRAADVIVLSPGVPPEQAQVAAACAAGVPVVGELELAASRLTCPVVAITGTNGKSTTTTFAGDMLEFAGLAPFVGGNLGIPLSDGIREGTFQSAVLEVSSFQLETAPTFHPQVAAMLNLAEDHLDRYPDFGAYRRAKERIYANLRPGDTVVYNAADPLVRETAATLPSRMLAFSLADHGRDGAFLDGGRILLREGDNRRSLTLDGFRVAGSHNVENLLAALLCVRALGVETAVLQDALPLLRGLPHRMEWIREVDGVRWYNDSKGTNVASTAKTLEGTDRPTVLLLGGKDKGGDYGPLVRMMDGRVRNAVLYGQSAPIIEAALAHCPIPHETVADLPTAVARAVEHARTGDLVLLSPACSSYDQFDNYEQRGDLFRKLVEAL